MNTRKRGIITPPAVFSEALGGIRMERGIRAEELRYLLLYWDEIVIPGNNLVYVQLPDERDLMACGAVSRPRVKLGPGNDVSSVLACEELVARDLIGQDDTDWVLHQASPRLALLSESQIERNVLRVSLVNALPAPGATVQIADILEFKERRQSELVALHESLDEIYQGILGAPDRDLAKRSELARLSQAIDDLGRTTFGSFESRSRYDLTVHFNLDASKLASGVTAGAIIAAMSDGISAPLAVAAGALVSTLNLSATAQYVFEPAQGKRKLAYLSRASGEGMLQRDA